jgi:hypothetical protein
MTGATSCFFPLLSAPRSRSDSPGCFGLHLQRRDGSLLFSPERRIVTHSEIEKAKEKDHIEQEQFTQKVKTYWFTTKIMIDKHR